MAVGSARLNAYVNNVRRRRNRHASGGGPTPSLRIQDTSNLFAIYAIKPLVPEYSGALITVCAVGAATTPPLTVDVFAGADDETPDFAAAIAAFGARFAVHTYHDQLPGNNDATASTTSRHVIDTAEGMGIITTDIGGSPYVMPNGIVASAQNATIIQVSEDRGAQLSGMVAASLGNTGASAPYVWLGAATGIQATGGGASAKNIRRAPFADRPYLKAVRADATATKFWRNMDSGPPTSAGVLSANVTATAGGSIGSSRNGSAIQPAQYTSKSVIYATIFGNGSVTDAQIENDIRAACIDTFDLRVADYDTLVCFIGDSLGWGQGSVDAKNFPHYLNKKLRASGMLNVAITNPSTAASLLTSAYSGRQDWRDLRETGKKFKVIIQRATNDFGTTTVSAATLWTGTMLPLIQYYKAVAHAANTSGFIEVAVETVTPRLDTTWVADPQKEIERLAFNQLLRDNAVANGYTVLDRANNPDMADPNNTTFFVNDKLHHLSAAYSSNVEYEWVNGLQAFIAS